MPTFNIEALVQLFNYYCSLELVSTQCLHVLEVHYTNGMTTVERDYSQMLDNSGSIVMVLWRMFEDELSATT